MGFAQNDVFQGFVYMSHDNRLPLTDCTCFLMTQGEKKRKEYAFRRQFNEKPGIIPGCPRMTQGPNISLVCLLSVVSTVRLVVQGLPASGAGLMRIISCCSQLAQWDQAYAAWTLLQADGMQPDGPCINALLAALQAAKQWQHVVQVFQAARQTQVANDGPWAVAIQP